MFFGLASKAICLLIFINTTYGSRKLNIEHHHFLNATVGQNISLPCIISREDKNIIQLQWFKVEKTTEKKIVVVNPMFPVHYLDNGVKLELVNKTNSTHLRGSILHLYGVTEKDIGDFICDFTVFPDGSFKCSTKLQVTEPYVYAMITPQKGIFYEGDKVNIKCVSNPPADTYKLQTSEGHLIMESRYGNFSIPSITRHNSNLICQPLWSSSAQHLHNLRESINLTVEYIDTLVCNFGSQIQVEAESNLTITCKVNSSRSLHYDWKKGNTTMSQNATIYIWPVSHEHSGNYTLVVYAEDHKLLQKRMDFFITVLDSIPREHWSSTMAMETTSELGSTTMTPTTTPTNSTNFTMVQEDVKSTSPTAPFAGTSTTEHSNITSLPSFNVTSSLSNSPSSSSYTTTESNITESNITESNITESNITESSITESNITESSITESSISESSISESSTISKTNWENITYISESTRKELPQLHLNYNTITTPDSSTSKTTHDMLTNKVVPETEKNNRKSHIVYVIIPLLFLLSLIGFLYRRYLLQKRMDMPPPFKPPPPPVKYTSSKSQEILMTDITL